MYFIFGNYGDNTVALIQWATLQKLETVTVLHVDTGWAAAGWGERVEEAQQFVRTCGFEAVTLKPPSTFPEQIQDRGQFPTIKFQWCAGFLKGLAFLDWADQVDPACAATVILPSRRADSRARFDLPEFEDDNEHFGGRRVWYPLYQTGDEERLGLIEATGLEFLGHRSLECQPCVHSTVEELAQLAPKDRLKIKGLEGAIGKPLLSGCPAASFESFDMGCGAQYGCGE